MLPPRSESEKRNLTNGGPKRKIRSDSRAAPAADNPIGTALRGGKMSRANSPGGARGWRERVPEYVNGIVFLLVVFAVIQLITRVNLGALDAKYSPIIAACITACAAFGLFWVQYRA